MTRTTLLAATFALLTAACGSRAPTTGQTGVIIQADLSQATVDAVTTVSVRTSPYGTYAELIRDADTGRFTGTLQLPAGPQSLTVEAWADLDQDGTPEVVAAGSADTTIVEGQTALVLVRLVDTAPPPPVPDHAPMILSFGVANVNPMVGESVAVSASAYDPDGDAISYAWAADCTQGAATFANASAAATTVSVDQAGSCSVSITASANGKQVGARVTIQVGTGGNSQVDIQFVAAPTVASVTLSSDANAFGCFIDRYGNEATCSSALASGAVVDVVVGLDADSDGAEAQLVTCGGSAELVETGPGMAHWLWTTPINPGPCILTASTSRDGRSDTLPIALLLY